MNQTSNQKQTTKTTNFDFEIVAGDTDGLAFKKKDQKPFTDQERAEILAALNSTTDKLIRWEDDGVMKRQIVVKTKNYILVDQNNKVKIKGSALKATTKEKALQKFIRDVIELLIKDRLDQLFFLYLSYVRQIVNLKDISDWCSKKTVTKAVLTSERTNEARVRKALEGATVQEGDKVYAFFKTPEELCLRENFDGTYDRDVLLGKLYDSLYVFETVIQTDLFPNLSLKRNQYLIPNTNRENDERNQAHQRKRKQTKNTHTQADLKHSIK